MPVINIFEESFTWNSMKVFKHQLQNNQVYKEWVEQLEVDLDYVTTVVDIPFLPIQFFKTHEVVCGENDSKLVFRSSTTTGSDPSQHYVKDPALYEASFIKGFHRVYGDPNQYSIFALLPSYLEQKGSSLIYMCKKLIKATGDPLSGFYLDDYDELVKKIQQTERTAILFGVSFALLDLAQKKPLPLENTIIVETGGMKGRKEEITRAQLHKILCDAFSVEVIHSEYGMTELLSQAWSTGDQRFRCPPWMKVYVRDINDPLSCKTEGYGPLNIIDLANMESCSFIATDDLGYIHEDGSFEVMGRMDGSDIRGCNLMMVED